MTMEFKVSLPLGQYLRTSSASTLEFSRKRTLSARSLGSSQLLCASLLLLAALAGCSSQEEKPAPPPPGVTVTPVVQKDVDIKQEWVGNMLGNIDANIRPKVDGFLLSQDLLGRFLCQ